MNSNREVIKKDKKVSDFEKLSSEKEWPPKTVNITGWCIPQEKIVEITNPSEIAKEAFKIYGGVGRP